MRGRWILVWLAILLVVPRARGEGPYTVQVGAMKSPEGAKCLLERVKPVAPCHLERRGGYWAVCCGRFADRAQAERLRDQLEPMLGVRGMVRLAGREISLPQESAGGTTALPRAGEARITLDFKGADIRDVLRLVAEAQGWNLVLDEGVKGRITLRLRDVPWEQALKVILDNRGLGVERIDNILHIAPLGKLRKKEELEPLVTKFLVVRHAKVEELLGKLNKFKSPRGILDCDPRTNTLIVTDVAAKVRRIEEVLRSLDRPTYQVQIEARVVQASTSFVRELGVQWGGSYAWRRGVITGGGGVEQNTIGGRYPTVAEPVQGTGGMAGVGALSGQNYVVNLPAAVGAGTGGAIGIMGRIGGSILELQLSAREDTGEAKVISSPKVVTMDGKEATIQQGTSIPYETVSDAGTQTEWVDATLKLTVTPYITPDAEHVRMKISVTKNAPNTGITSASGVPSMDKREAETEVLVKDGETVVIGGIYETSSSRNRAVVPWFHRIPLLGHLFRHTSRDLQRTELLIFVTPRILKNAEVPDRG